MSRRARRPHPRPLATVAVAATAVLLLVAGELAWGPSLHSARSGAVGPWPTAVGSVTIAPAYAPAPGVSDLGALPARSPIEVAVALAPRDAGGLAASLTLEYTPGAPEYHHYLTGQQIADRFGPSASAYAAARSYFAGFGASTTTSPDRTFLLVHGTSSSLGAAFHTRFDTYRDGASTFYNHPTPATLPAAIPWLGALGLGNDSLVRPLVHPASPGERLGAVAPAASCNTTAPFAPCAIQLAYNATSDIAAGDNGSGFRYAVVDPYAGQENQTQLASDLSAFTANFGIALGTVDYLYPVPTTRNLNATATVWATEEALDLEWARAMAPGATIEMTFAPDAGAGLYGAVDWLIAHHAADVISLSWGEPDTGVYDSFAGPCSSACNASSDGSYAILHPALVDAAAEGITVLAASGDCGSAEGTDGVSTSYPASDPAVLGVGGTDLSISSGAYGGETAWSGNETGATSPGCTNNGGSGGGFAPFPRPWWQRASGLASTPNLRGVPDVAADAGVDVDIVQSDFILPVGGTSASTPMWGGFVADADTAYGAALGFVNPALYPLLSTAPTAFHDVTSGSNGYKAGTGWDPVTGLGSPDFARLVPQLTRPPSPLAGISVTLSATPRFAAVSANVAFTVGASGGQTPYGLTDVNFGDGNASIARSMTASHRYTLPGVYVALATVFDAASNSSVSSPLAIVIGGGNALAVTLNASASNVSLGTAVTLSANASGGTGPYEYYFSFGDGTYLTNATSPRTVHTYDVAGSFCPSVVAWDATHPPDGGASPRVPVAVGGAPPSPCANGPNLTATAFTSTPIRDLPGDVNLSLAVSGGTPPYSVQWVTNDAYVNACDCGIFRTSGPHALTAYVNDSVNAETTAHLNVTLFPALVGRFTHTALSGPAPWSATFSASAIGGDAPNASDTTWSFVNTGAGVQAASATHTWDTPGQYVVIGRLADAAGGVTSVAYLVDVLASAGDPALTAVVSPAQDVPAGTPVSFSANVTNGSGPYAYRWDLGDDGDSAYGANVTQTFGADGCVASGVCPLVVGLSATPVAGPALTAAIIVPQAVSGHAVAVSFTDYLSSATGVAPLLVQATANVSGMPGLAVAWSFGDGATGSGSAVAHPYARAGNYTLTETVTDALGDVLVRTHAISVGASSLALPSVVSGGPNVAAGLAPLFVQFYAVVAGGGGPPYTATWEFGDGSTGMGGLVVHQYTTPGRYNATVTVTDRLNRTNSTAYSITAYAVTSVSVEASLVPTRVAPGGLINVSGDATPHCTNLSVPGCAPTAFSVAELVRSQAGGPTTLEALAAPGPTGGLFAQFAAPVAPGAYWLNVSVESLNFTGNVQLPFTVAAGANGSTPAFSVSSTTVLVLGAAVAALVVAGTAVARRRPTEPPPSP